MPTINDLPHHLHYSLNIQTNQKVTHLEFEPCQAVLVIAGTGGIQLWDAASGAKMYDLQEKSFFIFAENATELTLSNHGQLVAAMYDNQQVKLWNTGAKKRIRTIKTNSRQSHIALTQNGNKLAITQHKNIQLWNMLTGQIISTPQGRNVLQGHSEPINSITFNQDGNLLMSGSDDETIKLWDATNLQLLRTLREHGKRVSIVECSPTEAIFASGSLDKTIKIWDIASETVLHTLIGHYEEIKDLAFSPDGKVLASCSEDKTIRLWDVQTGEQIHILQGHKSWIHSVSFSATGEYLASASVDGEVNIWSKNLSS
jgi:WD40 repeat protein